MSFYWCYRADGSLACMIAELNNTFGERLPSCFPATRSTTSTTSGSMSPFMGLDQRYRYTFSEPGETVFARIEVHEGDRCRSRRCSPAAAS